MKALTDKIIDKLKEELILLENPIDPDGLIAFNAGVKRAIIVINELEKGADFEEVARVMMKHLGQRTDLYCPHHTVIIDNSHAELVQGQRATGIVMDYIPD